MANIFKSVQGRKPGKSKFDLSHEKKLTMKMGQLIPAYVQEVVPGDKFKVSSEALIRMAPLLAPIMHRVNVKMEYFAVPYRLIWNEWEKFITGGVNGTDAPVAPYMEVSNVFDQELTAVGTLWDHMGLPPVTAAPTVDLRVSSLPFRAYQLVYNEYYRDETLTVPIEINKESGEEDNMSIIQLCTTRNRSWEKDYFTSALPWPQRGADISLPIDGLEATNTINYSLQATLVDNSGNPIASGGDVVNNGGGGLQVEDSPNPNINAGLENIDSIDTEITGTSTTINELRRTIRLQEWLEKNARAGYRYIEQIFSHFGVKSSDARLQRPEFLGGSTSPMAISEVLSTVQQVNSSGDPIGNPQGDMTGRGISYNGNNGFVKFFEEHCIVIGFLSVVPKTAYQQGVPKMFSRFDKFDYYWPEFAQLGEQEVKNKELYYTGAAGTEPEGTFGYQSRYSEYKYNPSTVHGDFRTTLAFWHEGRIFDAEPNLNESFVASDPSTRIFAVETGDHLWCQVYNKVSALRPMPYFGTPTI